MPRATRYLEEGYVYHLTHRCDDGQFFLNFRKERDLYREWLRVGSQRHGIPILGYSITRNHVHVIAEAVSRQGVAGMMQLAAGTVAQDRNQRKGHYGSMWEHPYHCTRIQDGKHLINCLRYVDMNMVRAGKVKHPIEWRWCGYDELCGKRQRYRVVDIDRLLQLAGYGSMCEFSEFYVGFVADKLTQNKTAREPHWTEAVAVGDRRFVQDAEASNSYRHKMELYEIASSSGATWAVREARSGYNPDLRQE